MPSQFREENKVVYGLGPVTPSSSTPDYVSLKNYRKLTIVIQALNATTVTGSAITVLQATDVAATGAKAVSFTTAYRNIDCAASDTLSAFTVSSNTFTTDATNSKQLLYIIEIDETDLDIDNGFDCVRLGTGNATATTLSVLYILSGAKSSTLPAAITD